MLSYQHGYHAGNFADVIKHIALTHLLNYLTRKDKALFYLETHSGKGLYDLKNKQAEKTQEYKQGIQLIWPDRNTLPPVFQNYFQLINQLNSTNSLRYYPGSPFLAINTLRMQDRMYFCELHPREFEALSQLQRMNKKVHFSNSDGIAAMKALVPPPEKRGLIFIDPSFEIKEEYREIPLAIKHAYSRFATGVFCLWYPLVDKKLTDKLNRGMKEISAKALRIEFNLTSTAMEGMSGCGLWIINPPFTLAEEMKTVLNTLKTHFNPGSSSYIIEAYS
ncbi:23S rRNA (adenine(2030)-N(6))-methyltransferase RlmJ [Fluoribacter gormanii]|uniref:Ribosomal RNA large subunit methyltransferase J n=1 Tax=Fluoribacter gormanii TaxID=464 RepID=A0A377GI66_9GAMM|nr:23S rRNA (adenine(2030)-N(6))-methyltransferase RlmJ [Fluoribacter gormanii]KTD03448.1 protein involved in catabolism of external DNA [Fluoribacter gormanii]MCW8469147.1 23S rRNA (adenine(2030)-N(6))-methyltransferase RlmJ [Fluoribacter gormanii]SIQ48317.1 23S rRNA (adenine2030-N6)-methyltransferase [Fluoribacter gormanii]STO24476.1 Protein involved in catabolism of external DNA [Fluoribacter gormanii]